MLWMGAQHCACRGLSVSHGTSLCCDIRMCRCSSRCSRWCPRRTGSTWCAPTSRPSLRKTTSRSSCGPGPNTTPSQTGCVCCVCACACGVCVHPAAALLSAAACLPCPKLTLTVYAHAQRLRNDLLWFARELGERSEVRCAKSPCSRSSEKRLRA